MMLSPGSA
jgi:hypothetical protein